MSDIARDSCLVTWQAVKSMGRDRLEYSLQLQRLYGKDNSKADEYKEVRTVRACLSCGTSTSVCTSLSSSVIEFFSGLH